MDNTEKHLKVWLNHPLTDKSQKDVLLEKTDFSICDGMFSHHVSFFYEGANGMFYYRTFFGKGWHARKPNKEGWIKYLDSLAVNVYTKEIKARSKVFM